MEEEGADHSMSAQHSDTGFAQSIARAKQRAGCMRVRPEKGHEKETELEDVNWFKWQEGG